VLGRFLVTHKESDLAAFKTPDLRNVLVTAPYFHDGSQQTLWDTIDHYNKGDGLNDPWLDEDIQPLALTEPEIDDLVAFLASLTSSQCRELGEKEYARQLALSKVSRPQRDTARALGRSHPGRSCLRSNGARCRNRRRAELIRDRRRDLDVHEHAHLRRRGVWRLRGSTIVRGYPRLTICCCQCTTWFSEGLDAPVLEEAKAGFWSSSCLCDHAGAGEFRSRHANGGTLNCFWASTSGCFGKFGPMVGDGIEGRRLHLAVGLQYELQGGCSGDKNKGQT
jgi:hypothetical protein